MISWSIIAGVFFLVLGLLCLLKPLLKILIAGLFVYMGILLITGFNNQELLHNTVFFRKKTIFPIFSSKDANGLNAGKYATVFTQALVDLKNIVPEKAGTLTITTIGGKSTLYIPANIGKIIVKNIASKTIIPGYQTSFLGSEIITLASTGIEVELISIASITQVEFV